jgi:hypothetical protein
VRCDATVSLLHRETLDPAWLARVIHQAGMTPFEAARRAGIARQTLYDYLAGRRDMRVSKLRRVIEMLDHSGGRRRLPHGTGLCVHHFRRPEDHPGVPGWGL